MRSPYHRRRSDTGAVARLLSPYTATAVPSGLHGHRLAARRVSAWLVYPVASPMLLVDHQNRVTRVPHGARCTRLATLGA